MAGGDGADRLKSLLLLCYSMQSARECNSRCFDKSSIWLFPTTNKVATNRYWLRHCSSEARLTQKHDYMDTVVPQKSIRDLLFSEKTSRRKPVPRAHNQIFRLDPPLHSGKNPSRQKKTRSLLLTSIWTKKYFWGGRNAMTCDICCDGGSNPLVFSVSQRKKIALRLGKNPPTGLLLPSEKKRKRSSE